MPENTYTTTYTIRISHTTQDNFIGDPVLWRWQILTGANQVAAGTAHSEESAYIFAASAFSRIGGQTVKEEVSHFDSETIFSINNID